MAKRNSLSERVRLFRLVRDIPYRIGLSLDEQDFCCATKTPLLQKLLVVEGIKSRRICCRFRWKDTKLPRALIAKALYPEAGHEYLEAYVPEKKRWVAVDPTWDIGLKKTGFPIAHWNGVSATALAVKPIKIFSPEKSAAIIAQIEKIPLRAWKDFYKQNHSFFAALNNWFERQRNGANRA